MDNFFTSVPLAEKLHEKDLTIVGTLRKNKADVPPLMGYVQKKGKSVVLLSTMHNDKAVDESNQKKKPDVIQFYNKTKGGVDTS